MGWRDENLLPHHGGAGWAICEGNRVLGVEAHEVRNRLRRWQPQSGILVAVPGAARFSSPVRIPELAGIAIPAARRRTRLLMLVCAAAALLSLVLYALAPSRASLGWVFVFGGVFAMFAFDLAGPLRTVAGLDERARFLYWFRTHPASRIGTVFWSAFVTGIGVAQYLAMQRLGGLEAVFHAYGFMYDDVRAGELWRLLSGPLLHYSALHYMQNFLPVILMGVLAWVVLGAAASIATFFAGNALGALGQMFFGGQAFDNCGGISAGIYALFGLLCAYGAVRPESLPKGFAALCLIAALTGIGFSEIAAQLSATAAHLCGFMTGSLAAGLLSAVRHAARAARCTDS